MGTKVLLCRMAVAAGKDAQILYGLCRQEAELAKAAGLQGLSHALKSKRNQPTIKFSSHETGGCWSLNCGDDCTTTFSLEADAAEAADRYLLEKGLK